MIFIAVSGSLEGYVGAYTGMSGKFSGDLAMNNKTVNRIVEFYRRDFELFEYNIGVF